MWFSIFFFFEVMFVMYVFLTICEQIVRYKKYHQVEIQFHREQNFEPISRSTSSFPCYFKMNGKQTQIDLINFCWRENATVSYSMYNLSDSFEHTDHFRVMYKLPGCMTVVSM